MAGTPNSHIQRAMRQASVAQSSHPSQTDGGLESETQDCSWADVLASMEAARQEHQLKEEKNKLRAVQRNKALAATLHSLADMIPDQDGLSILRGGLKTIFMFVEKRIENSERILVAFEDIPITFSNACNATRAYPNDESLCALVKRLYFLLKTEIPKLIEVLLRKQKGSLAKRLIKQHPENEALSIDHSLDLVTRASNKVMGHINLLGAQTMVTTFQQTTLISQEISKTQGDIAKLADEVKLLQGTQHDFGRNVMAHYDIQEQLTHSFLEKIHRDLQQSFEFYEMQLRTGFYSIQESLQGLMWGSQILPQQSHSIPSTMIGAGEYHAILPNIVSNNNQFPDEYWSHTTVPHPPSEASIPLSYDDIYLMLRLPNPCFCVKDLDSILKASSSMAESALSRAAWLLQMNRFKMWAQTYNNSSDLILIEGHLGDESTGKISPLSVLSANFGSMNKIPNLLIITHFCGLHTRPGDPMKGCRGMLLNLVTQIIMKLRQDKRNSVLHLSENFINAIAQQDLDALHLLFRQLLDVIQQGLTVFVILDNISEFETSFQDRQDELSQVVRMLQSIIGQPRRWPVLKVLLTTANRSISVFRQIEPDSRISLSARNQSPWLTSTRYIENGLYQAMGSN